MTNIIIIARLCFIIANVLRNKIHAKPSIISAVAKRPMGIGAALTNTNALAMKLTYNKKFTKNILSGLDLKNDFYKNNF